ncbi:MAG: TIGR00266 family protein [Acidobacteriota bacterium]
MSQWYISVNGQQVGPLGDEDAVARAKDNPGGHAWKEGFAEWKPINQIPELCAGGPVPGPPPRGGSISHEIDYKIFGEEMQFVEVELDPGESAIAEAGAMMYKDLPVSLETIFGDGSAKSSQDGFMGKLVGAGKRLITGESLFITVFTHKGGSGKAKVAFASPYPGSLIPVSLKDIGGSLVCQKDSFLCAAKGVSIGIYLQKKILTGLFGGEGFIMQKLEGDGKVFVHAGGCVIERELRAGETLHVDTGCVVAFQPTVNFEIQQVGGIKSALFGGEGLFFATITGPGKLWMQSLPFSRFAGRMLQAAPASKGGGGKRTGEGSILGGLGDLLDGK